ncbi:SAM-dependent methyltransferase [Anaerobacillus arseniciselenatis]|uniref:SAM-dependent methyltransferase n=1 Tax=Anaerobacillus arseniciselenatis TaxID=85682 RepID=A0A1S2LC59_9BACI|nr:class I SAM-dependent methyltransferase [Anaerobacillus arseniciselenatis]OIJ09840.1 SAM-dependent methyltransferase [Anaerobacillus arseniciselenatis]
MRKMDGEEFDQLVRFFDGMATTSWLSSIHLKLKQFIGSWEGKVVLDVGCGTGRFLLKGIDEAKQVIGIDLSQEMVKASEDLFLSQGCKNKSSFIVADACELPFSEGEFDITVSTCVLFLLPEPEVAMDEMIRVTKKDGVIAMLNPSLKMSQEEAKRYCEQHGITGFEQKTLLQWSKISTSRHRYSTDELSQYFTQKGAREIKNIELLDNLAIITVAKF